MFLCSGRGFVTGAVFSSVQQNLIYARTDILRGVYKAPANEVVRGLTKFEININKRRQDVLNPDFAGFTDSYTLLNATVGAKWADGKVTTSIKGTNLLNKTIQQHVYGDILKLGVVGEVRVFVK